MREGPLEDRGRKTNSVQVTLDSTVIILSELGLGLGHSGLCGVSYNRMVSACCRVANASAMDKLVRDRHDNGFWNN